MKITTYNDYTEELYKEFDKVDQSSIRTIVRYGLNKLNLFNRCGLDTLLNSQANNLFYYMGDNYSASSDYQRKINRKYKKKTRLLYLFSKRQYNGYYYFTLTEEDHLSYLKGDLGTVKIYKIDREANNTTYGKHKYRLAIENSIGWWKTIEAPAIDTVEYLGLKKKRNETTDK